MIEFITLTIPVPTVLFWSAFVNLYFSGMIFTLLLILPWSFFGWNHKWQTMSNKMFVFMATFWPLVLVVMVETAVRRMK